MTKQTIPASDEAWDEKLLGADEAFVKVAEDDIESSIDESLGLQMISIRLQKSLIEDFKAIAAINNGIGYQTLMRQVLSRFVECEKKRIIGEMAAEKAKAAVAKVAKAAVKQPAAAATQGKQRKVA